MDDRDSYSQSLLPPKVKEAMAQTMAQTPQINRVSGRPFPREQLPSSRTAQPTKTDANIRYLMPIYSFVIVMLFSYTIYRKWMDDRDSNDEAVNPVMSELNMDPEYLNRVMDILEDVKRHGNWQKAINDNILPRKQEHDIEQTKLQEKSTVNDERRIEMCDKTAPQTHFENNLRFRRRKSF